MRYPKKQSRWLISVILWALCFSLVAAFAMAQGSTPEKPKKAGEKGQLCTQGQASGKGLCTAGGECQVRRSPCQTEGQPSGKSAAAGAAKTEKEKKDK